MLFICQVNMEMEKRALSEEKSINLNEMIENEIQNDTEKCCSCSPRKKLIGLTTVIFCTLVISVVIIILHFYSQNNGKYL